MRHEAFEKIGLLCSQINEVMREEINNSQRKEEESISDNLLLKDLILQELERRKARLNFFPSELFGEGGWNILLDLMLHEIEQKEISITSACIASGLPSTTALRVVDMLSSMGLVHRRRAQHDKRMQYVSLTYAAKDQIRDYFLSSIAPTSGEKLLGNGSL